VANPLQSLGKPNEMNAFAYPETDPDTELNAAEAAESEAAAPAAEAPATEEIPAIDWEDRYLRLLAEFDNFRKRSAREAVERAQRGAYDAMEALIPILDDWDRSLAQDLSPLGEAAAFVEGQQLIHNKLNQILERQGLEKLVPEVGEAFDADRHEAITSVPHPDRVDQVVEVLIPGYALHGRIMRFPKVVVGK
jgi:molecular chaperone GrpE